MATTGAEVAKKLLLFLCFLRPFLSVTLAEKQQQLTDTLAVIPDPQERLAIVVDHAKKLPPLADHERTDAHLVRGCISRVHLAAELRDGRCHFRADADSPLVRGLVAFLCEFFSAATPAEIVASDADPLAELGLIQNLSPTRQNGLAAVRAAIRAFAQGHSAA
jgi:cysteine desulfuration protein SufE